jgi:hypothetical protein
MKHDPIITEDWRTVSLRNLNTPIEWEEAGPGNGWHSGPKWMPHCANQNVYTGQIELPAGDADYRVYICRDGSIHASNWIHIQKGKDNPWGRGYPVEVGGGKERRENNWSFITPEEARKTALISMAYGAEEMVIEALADGSLESQRAAYKIRAWAESQLGRTLIWAHSQAELDTAVQKRKDWLAERRAEHEAQSRRASEFDRVKEEQRKAFKVGFDADEEADG